MRDFFRANYTRAWLLVIPILLFAAWRAGSYLSFDALWYDEHASIYSAGGAQYGPLSPAGIWTRLQQNDPSHTPGFAWLLAGWGALVGWSEAAGRALAWLCGLLAIAWTYRFGRDAASRLAGLLAALLLASSYLFLFYLHELRMYAPLSLWVVVCLWAYFRIMQGRANNWIKITFFISLTTALYTHYLAVAMLFVLGLYHLALLWQSPRRWGAWWQVGLMVGAALVLYVPWLIAVTETLRARITTAGTGVAVYGSFEVLTVTPHLFANRAWPLLIPIGAFALAQWRRPALRFLLFWTAAALVTLVAINTVRPFIISYRYVLLLWPPAAVLAGIGMARLAITRPFGQFAAAGLLVVWVILGFVRADPIKDTGDYISAPALHEILTALTEHAAADDAAVFYMTRPGRLARRVQAYYTAELAPRSIMIDFDSDFEPGSDDYQQQARAFFDDAPYVWLTAAPRFSGSDYADAIENALTNADYSLCATVVDDPDLRLLLYRYANAADERGFACPA